MLYFAEKGKGQRCPELENEGFEVIFGGYCNKKCHISENTRCTALKFSGCIANTLGKLTLQYYVLSPYRLYDKRGLAPPPPLLRGGFTMFFQKLVT